MRIGRSVKSRVILALILILVPAVILLAFIFSAWYQARYGLAYTSTHERAVSTAYSFADYADDLGTMGAVAGEVLGPLSANDLPLADELLAAYRREIGNVSHLAFISPEGMTIAGSPTRDVVGISVADRDYYRRIVAGEDLVLSNVLVSRYSGQPTIAVIRAIRQGGRLQGMIAIYVDIQHLEPVFRPRLQNEILILLDPAGTLVYDSRHPDLSWDERRKIGPALYRQSVSAPTDDLVRLSSSLDKGDWLGDWTTVPRYGWRVGTFRPASLVTGPLQAEFNRGILWALLTLLVLAILIWYLGVSISQPATELSVASQSVASGDLGVRVRYGSNDEFGQVGRAFNQMVERLAEARSETEARQRQLEFLYEAGLAVTTTLSLDELTQVVIREIARVTNASIVEVFLYDEERRELTVCSQIGLPESNITTTFALGEGIPGQVAKEHRPIAVTDLQAQTGLVRRDMIFSEGLQSLLAVPLFTSGEIVGVIDLFTRERREFSESEVELTSTLASIAATGIANSRLYERERKIARTLEAAFIPSSSEIPGMDTSLIYRPKVAEAEIGGDFVDVIPLSGERYGVVVGDVAGKGLQAAVYTNMIKYSLRAYASDHLSPAEIVTAANRVVTVATELERFATLVYCTIGPDRRHITWVNAGHEDILIYRARTRSVEAHTSTSMAVGLQLASVFRQSSAELEPGDMVVLYTDGITEARREHDFFGPERVRETLADVCPCTAHTVAEALLARAYEFADHRFSDDVAILAFGPHS